MRVSSAAEMMAPRIMTLITRMIGGVVIPTCRPLGANENQMFKTRFGNDDDIWGGGGGGQ